MTTTDEVSGVINPDELYTLDAFKRRLGIREATVRVSSTGRPPGVLRPQARLRVRT